MERIGDPGFRRYWYTSNARERDNMTQRYLEQQRKTQDRTRGKSSIVEYFPPYVTVTAREGNFQMSWFARS